MVAWAALLMTWPIILSWVRRSERTRRNSPLTLGLVDHAARFPMTESDTAVRRTAYSSPSVITDRSSLAGGGLEGHGVAPVVKLHVVVTGDGDGIETDHGRIEVDRESRQTSHATGRAVVVDLDEVIGVAGTLRSAAHVGLTDNSDFHVDLLLFLF